ncbi:acyl-CoA dehydrogenase family protein [Mycolicibacterium smegmatis]|uniref:acyl-CoA dehydrogenase family protein n=1 Tax=Mycolicibacterium smegmatis TaxID=1772 RepID=UPI0005D81874|nr:acyl-CoA dehydrogenase family protein [Mycolicibacterium smegmatis]MDF1897398.1 acyl-CoA dehydrogenase family protein [Mycolicibacterium smegmatis]MDF1904159.1 acyl-CoA dehydrogenase family protein [Mycolicibacterium smegmatis]MDF1916964.1 acyl-CoA dehydrogenase family protein [Mycolicibacterium smegmatis]MDF1922338.1 acyl-CoA dehydrogenase family protein [Mycolicibacterium smegmatis]UAK56241.1 acyl-CoA dehydrogenase family protein [Mycolicibacterium smegmatis]
MSAPPYTTTRLIRISADEGFDPARRWPVATEFGVTHILADLARQAAHRDATRESPAGDVRRLQQAGVPALRLPTELGGRGIPLARLFAFAAELADADPSVAHALRNHFWFVEQALRSAPDSPRRAYLARVADGDLIGGSFGELHTSKAGDTDFSTTLAPHGDGSGTYVLNGDKFYSTGNIFCDVLIVKAVYPDGTPVTAAVPATRAGVDLTDDWDGIGQRLTGSGSTRFRDVTVHPHEVVPDDEFAHEKGSYTATFPQLYLTTVVAGILRTITADAVELVRGRRRNYYHGSSDEPRHEPAVQSIVGQISVNSHAADAIVASAAQSLERARDTEGPARDEALLQASLDAARAKISVDELAARTGWLLFETGGATSVRTGLNLDRHWRNARTLASHNPDSYKLRYLGDHLLNGATPPTGSFF